MKTPSETHRRGVAGILLVAVLLGIGLSRSSRPEERSSEAVDRSDARMLPAPRTAKNSESGEEPVARRSDQIQGKDSFLVWEQPGDEAVHAHLRRGPSPWQRVEKQKLPVLHDALKKGRAPIANEEEDKERARRMSEYFAPQNLPRVHDIPFDLSTPEARARTVKALRAREDAELAEAEAWARAQGLPMVGERGRLIRLEEGRPVYYATDNIDSVISINVHPLAHSPYNELGESWKIGVWDGGFPRGSHESFDDRVRYLDAMPAPGTYALQILQVERVEQLPPRTVRTVVAARVGTAAHVRVFDGVGTIVADVAEGQMNAGPELVSLRQTLNALPLPEVSDLSEDDRVAVIKDAVGAAGHTLTPDPDSHATHVIGTIAGNFRNPDARGMAPQAEVTAYNNGNDTSEMTTHGASTLAEAADSTLGPFLTVTNHSYGAASGWEWAKSPRYGVPGHRFISEVDPTQDSKAPTFGLYNGGSQAIDVYCYGAPYALPFWSAGNDRGDGPREGGEGWIERGSGFHLRVQRFIAEASLPGVSPWNRQLLNVALVGTEEKNELSVRVFDQDGKMVLEKMGPDFPAGEVLDRVVSWAAQESPKALEARFADIKTLTEFSEDLEPRWQRVVYNESVHPPRDGRTRDGNDANDGYETIDPAQCAKNVVTVGSVSDATEFAFVADEHSPVNRPDTMRWPRAAKSSSFSGFGPTDDGRLKPDLVANGEGLLSARHTGDDHYSSISGTSMATPSASGAALLLNAQYHRGLNTVMRASTLKGLLLHTADDLAAEGPDYGTGYGLLNAKFGADLIRGHALDPSKRWIFEGALIENEWEREEFWVEITGPIRATLSWTDPEGVARPADDRTLQLVHDLDLRIIGSDGTVLRPWVLDPSIPEAAATRGDNFRDNVERIDGQLPLGPARVIISHKGLSRSPMGGLPLEGDSIDRLRDLLRRNQEAAVANNQDPPAAPNAQVYSLLLSGASYVGTFAEAVDNDSESFRLVGSRPELGWAYQEDETFDLRDAVASPTIGEGEFTGFQTTVQGPVVVHYAVKVSSQSGRASFRLRVDTNIQEELSGEVDWTLKHVMIPKGTHTIRWEYQKTGSVNRGADRVWVDQIQLTSVPTITSAVSVGSQTIVSWDYERDCAGYTLYYNTSPSLEGARQRTVAESDCREARDPFNPLGGYYAVSVWDQEGGTSILSEWVKAEVVLPAPGFLVATQGDFLDRVELRWGEVRGATSYLITRKIREGSTRIFNSSDLFFVDSSLPVGEEADYTVIARNGEAQSGPSPSATGYRLDASSFQFSATDGSVPERIEMRWPARLAHYRVLRTEKNVNPHSGQTEVVELQVLARGFVADDDVVPGVRYYYWLETRPIDHIVEYNEWTLLASDSGWAGAAPDLQYTVTSSEEEGGPQFRWIDISATGERNPGWTTQPLECYGLNEGLSTRISPFGYVASFPDQGDDRSNACPLPAAAGVGESGTRVLPYHDDLTGGTVYFHHFVPNTLPHGSVAETLRVYQWEGVRLASGGDPFSFQAIQFSESKDWLFQYKAGSPGGTGATVGIQHFDKGKAAVFSCNESAIPSNREFAVLFDLQDPDRQVPVTNLVTTLVDENHPGLGQGNGNSLRELIAHAPRGEDGKVHISFPPSMAGRTITLNSEINFGGGNRPVVIDGSAAPGLVISGGGRTRLFSVHDPEIILRNLTLADGMTSVDGGAVFGRLSAVGSFVTLEGVTIRDCVAGRNGGAIASSTQMRFNLINCTLSGNRAGDSGGALFFNRAPAQPHDIRNTTVAHNHAGERGGGMYNFWAGEDSGELIGCLFANNTAVLSGRDIHGKAWSGGYNLFGSSAHITGIGSKDLKDVNPQLGPLADNGGPTMTHALLEASPAIDRAADAAGGVFLAVDQRGVARGIEGDFDLTYNGPDIGSYEFTPELIVTTEDDTVARDGKTSLRELVDYANANGGGSIRFAPGIASCVLSRHLTIDTEVTIDGGEAQVAISGNQAVRLFEVEQGSLSLRDLKLIDGRTNGSPGGFGAAIEMHVGSTLAAVRCSFTGHAAQSDAGVIYNLAGKVTLVDCTLSGNASGNKGGIIWNSGRLHLEGCTVSGNSGRKGGAIFNHDKGRVTVLSSTMTDNNARDFGGAIHNEGVVAVESSIVTNNPSGDGKEISANAPVLQRSSLLRGDPQLAPLGDYGGPTKTRPPLLESPALDASTSEPWRMLTSNRDQVTSSANTPPGEEADSVVDGGTSSTFRGYRSNLLAYWNFDDHRNDSGSRDLVGNVDGVFHAGATRSPRFDSYFHNFDAVENGQRELGDGSDLGSNRGTQGIVQDGQLRLTQTGMTGTRTSYRIPAPRHAESGWKATFDFTLSAGANPADGFSFNYGAIPARTTDGPEPTGHGKAEEGWGSGVEHISFEVDTWQPAGQSEYGVNIAVNDHDVAHTFGRPVLANSTVSGTVTITWHPVNGASFQTTGLHTNANFSNVSTAGFDAAAGHSFAFSARTGGATETVHIDNVHIEALNSGGDYALDLGGAGSQALLVENAGQFLNEAAAGDAITVSWWQKQSAVSNTTSFWAVSPSSSGSQRGISGHLPWGNGTIFYDSAGCCATPGQRLNGNPPTGTDWTQWTHVALVKSGDQKQVWIDGQLALAQGGAAPLPTDFTKLYLGSNATGGESLRGLIDHVAVFKGALTGGEIQDLMVTGVTAPDELVLDLTLADGPALPTEMRIFSAPHDIASDPAAFRLEGSNGGEHFEFIAEGPFGPFSERGDFEIVPLAPKFPYQTYRLTLIGAADPSNPGIQIAEVELLRRYDLDQRGKLRMADGDGDLRPRRDIGAVESQSVVVNTAADENNGVEDGIVSLRDALATDAELIFFDPRVFDGESSDVIALEHGPLAFSSARSVDASPLGHRVIISGREQSKVVVINSGAFAALRGLVVRDGKTFPGGSASSQDGAGVSSLGSLTLIDCVITENDANRIGGGIRAQDGDYLVMKDCTVSNNLARGLAGSGISLTRGTTGFITGSTISGNVLLRSNVFGGGGILCYGRDTHLRIEHCTIANNRSGKNGGGIQVGDRATMEMLHCTISGNTGSVGAGLLINGGAQAEVGNSLIAGNNGANVEGDFVDLGGNVVSGDPRLAPLGDYGGLTQTMMPRWDSPALGAGENSIGFSFRTDQRGQPRIADRGVDAGSVENSALAFLNVSDLDGDGMGDEWEASYGFNPLDPSDGELDADGDGVSNAGEFAARSNPRDAVSTIELLSFQRQGAGDNTSRVTVVWTSVPNVTYSLWKSNDLKIWTPISETNIIAVEGVTELSVMLPTEAQQFVRIAVGRGDDSRPFYASFRNALREIRSWEPAGLVSPGNGQPVTRWTDSLGQEDLLANGSPLLREESSPTGEATVEFRGGAHNDVFSSAGNSSLNGANSFTVAVAFQPNGDSEVTAGNQWTLKSQLVAADILGANNDWGLSFGGDSIWFGVGDSTAGDATLQIAAGSSMANDWWIAVGSWTADDGTGSPRFSCWLYDQRGNLIAGREDDPNTVAGSANRFQLPRANSGIALGGLRANRNARNFDGSMAAIRIYDQFVDAAGADHIAEELTTEFTNDARPE